MVGQQGPATLAVIVGQHQGRWATEVKGKSRPALAAQRALQDAGLDLEPVGLDRIVGLAVVVGWRCVTGEAGHEQTLALMKASESHHSRRNVQRFLEHKVLASTEFSFEVPLPQNWQYLPALSSCRLALDQARSLGQLVTDVSGRHVGIGQLLEEWASTWELQVDAGLLWPVFTPIAEGMVRRSWFGDVSRWPAPSLGGLMDMAPAPCRPSTGVLQHFCRMPIHLVSPADEPLGDESTVVWASKRGCVKGYTPAHLIRCVRASRGASDKDKEKTKQSLVDSMRFFFPRTWQRVMATAEVPLENMPSGQSVRQATVSLDQAAMLWSRSAARARGPVARYISFDASPQHGQEIFVTVERVVERTALRSLRRPESTLAISFNECSQNPPFPNNQLPLTTFSTHPSLYPSPTSLTQDISPNPPYHAA